MRKIAISVLLLIALGSAVWFLLYGADYALNFLLAAVSSALIVYASYLGYAKLIKTSVNSSSNDSMDTDENRDEDDEDEDEAISKKQAVARTYKGWLFPFRLLAYVLLVFVFLALSSKDMLVLAPFLTGLAVMPIAVLAQFYFTRKAV